MATIFDLLIPGETSERDQIAQLRLALETSRDSVVQLLAWVGLSTIELRRSPASEGYEPALIDNGFHPIAARSIAKTAVRVGRRHASEAKHLRTIIDSIRFLSKPRQTRAVRTRAKIIVDAWNNTSIVETLFDRIGQSETELIAMLKCSIDNKPIELERLAAICTQIVPHLSLDRGPKIGAPSAAHSFLVENGVRLKTKRRPHARGDRSASNSDALTEATQREFDTPNFDSRPAHRRLKRSVNRIK